MIPKPTRFDRASIDREARLVRLTLTLNEAQTLAYAARIFGDVMRDAGDKNALEMRTKMLSVRDDIIKVL